MHKMRQLVTVFIKASIHGHLKVVAAILNENLEVNLQNRHGKTALNKCRSKWAPRSNAQLVGSWCKCAHCIVDREEQSLQRCSITSTISALTCNVPNGQLGEANTKYQKIILVLIYF